MQNNWISISIKYLKKDVNTGLSTDFNANTFIPYLSAGTRNRNSIIVEISVIVTGQTTTLII
jgi:hypothetical protein